MNFLKLVWLQCKFNCRDLLTLIYLVVYPILVTLLLELSFQNSEPIAPTLAVINHDQGELATKMLQELTTEIIYVDNLEAGLLKLEEQEAWAVYEIHRDFTDMLEAGQMPQIVVYQSEAQDMGIIEAQVQQFLQRHGKQNLAQNYGLSYQWQSLNLDFSNRVSLQQFDVDMTPIVMILSYMLLFAGRIAQKLRELKSNLILKRLTTAPREPVKIVLSLCASYMVTQLILVGITSLVFTKVMNYQLGSPSLVLLALVLMSLIVTSWAILLARIFENVVLIEWIAIISLIILLGLGAMAMNVTTAQIPEFISVAALFSPLYWIFEIWIFQNLFPSVGILLLMVLVLLSAGSLKREQFLQDEN